MLIIKSEQNSRGSVLDSFRDEWGDEFKASICRSDGGKIGLDREWKGLPEVRKAIQSKQFLEHLET